jgi:tetratricopeptide (TPR) repeat protein
VLLVDNLERADPTTLALFTGLSRRTQDAPLALLFAERSSSDAAALGLTTLRSRCETLRLSGLSASETLELARSLFGEQAANVERFAGWLHSQTDGTPLYFLELVRQLVARDLIRLVGGLWVLPQQRPDAALPERLETALAERVQRLSPEARALCGQLALHRLTLSMALCQKLLPGCSEDALAQVLEELTRADALRRIGDSYAFANAALRDAVAQSMPEYERLDNHRQLGRALLAMASDDDHRLRMEAGWHLIQGGSDGEGADLIMRVTCDCVVVRRMVANLYHVGQTVAAALEVYTRERRSAYERMPLLGALAHAGFYENPMWGDRYGDQALDVLQDISGLATARRMRRFLGRYLSLMFGLWSAFGRFLLTPKRERPYSFLEVITQVLSAATTVTAVAASSLDAERAERVAQVIEPFSVLPERLTPVGIYQFCLGLQQIARERQVEATRTFEELLKRFRDPRYYPTLPPDARVLYSSGLLFAIGSFSVFRAHSQVALKFADELDASGLKMYAMVASQVRYLYHCNRGEVELAVKHREQVELHAVHVGSAAQVERWESPALLPFGILTGDVVGTMRAMHRLQMDSGAPYLRPYQRLAEATAQLTSGSANVLHVHKFLQREVTTREPRSFIGWAMTNSSIVRGLLQQGEYARAEEWCLATLAHINDDDREYVGLFLDLDLQLAHAEAALGKFEIALTRLSALLARHESSEHPLALGLLHEARARISHAAGRRDDYIFSTREAERWLRPTNMSQLIAKCERLWELGRTSTGTSMRPDPLDPASVELTSVGGIRTETSFATSAGHG